MRAYDIIYKKRNEEKLSQEEINFFIDGYNSSQIADYQMSAFLMAIYFAGLDDEETFFLTKAMANSGTILDLNFLDGPTADKHSTGGVGDGTSLVIAPILASCDIYVPMMSGRALGHTGGTLDKLESIPGFNVNLSIEQFKSVLKQNHFAMIGQTAQVAPVDKKMYALRDVTATVESIPLICSSIMSKKIAEGANCLLLDVKTGNGAFMAKYEDSVDLAKKMVSVGKQFNRNMVAVISDMDNPLGNYVGNSLEMIQTIEVLKGNIKNDFYDLCIQLCALTLVQTGIAKTIETAKTMAEQKISGGKALEKFIKMIEYQNGNPKVVDDYTILGTAKNVYQIKADRCGYINSIETRTMGIISCMLGAGRMRTEDKIDYTAGIKIYNKVGDYVNKGDILFELNYNNAKIDNVIDIAKKIYKISEVKPKEIKLVKNIIN